MPRLTKEEWVSRAVSKHGDFYDYSKVVYKNSTTKVKIICPIHGEFYTNPRNHISAHAGKCGCPKCAGRGLTDEEWVSRFKGVHGSSYDYSLFEYCGIFEKSEIICKKHGVFNQTPHNHYNGQGCPECALEKAWLGNSFYNINNAEVNKDKWSNMEAIVYIVEINSKNEYFYKIGITSQPLPRRLRGDLSKHYSYKLIWSTDTNLYNAIYLENELHKEHVKYKYEPLHNFKGHTECFSDINSKYKEE